MSYSSHIFGSKKVNAVLNDWYIDTKPESLTDETYTLRRESDSAEQNFSYNNIINGNALSWANGAALRVVTLTGNNANMTNLIQSRQFYLNLDTGVPVLDSVITFVGSSIQCYNDLSQDFIITLVVHKELNGNNGRSFFGVDNSTQLKKVFIELSAGSTGYLRVAETNDGSTSNSNLSYIAPYVNDAAFKLLTVARIGGIYSGYDNNVLLNPTSGSWSMATLATDNASLSGKGDIGDKKNLTKHAGLKTGVLNGFDISTYNQLIMSKYGL